MVYSLLENGFTKEDVFGALVRLAGETRGDDWKNALESRERARGLGR